MRFYLVMEEAREIFSMWYEDEKEIADLGCKEDRGQWRLYSSMAHREQHAFTVRVEQNYAIYMPAGCLEQIRSITVIDINHDDSAYSSPTDSSILSYLDWRWPNMFDQFLRMN